MDFLTKFDLGGTAVYCENKVMEANFRDFLRKSGHKYHFPNYFAENEKKVRVPLAYVISPDDDIMEGGYLVFEDLELSQELRNQVITWESHDFETREDQEWTSDELFDIKMDAMDLNDLLYERNEDFRLHMLDGNPKQIMGLRYGQGWTEGYCVNMPQGIPFNLDVWKCVILAAIARKPIPESVQILLAADQKISCTITKRTNEDGEISATEWDEME